ncbi:porin family protein [Mucilaginibacter sp.]|uniref:porin family protein n=1 Tax=Mucilaginibacter sp. TaxID=1882438 RepID=UPI00284B0998|nr:porin family protein [Mucilaginibacter sp.]MDR3693098.1 porin family protein [Mucilaginibacter sp.]
MKKILFFAMCLLFAGSVCAQGYYGHRRVRRPPPRSQYDDFYKVRVGLTGGLNVANTVDAYNSNFSTAAIAGFNLGLFLDVPLIYPLSFEPEILYSQKGYAAVTNYGNFTQRSNYIDVPLLAKFKLSPIFNILVGPQIAIPVSTTNTYDNGFDVTAQQYYNNYGQKTILDGVVGVSFDLSRDVELRARYTIDLQPNDQNASYGGDYRNQVWQIGLGFKFE